MLYPPDNACQRALQLAREAYEHGETPVGAVLCDEHGTILSEGRNQILEQADPSAHAELLAIRDACKRLSSERLPRTVLITTLEPCLMCSGLIIHARIPEVAFMTRSTSWPGLRSLLDNLSSEINHRPSWRLLEDYENSASELLTQFFEERRG
ncbi:MAG: tRNA-specific adenosine deaminase [Leptospiraceae bacterium]|nr:tRNA-specific adenosine deaminase [Leptospiraceae bacterium]